MRTVAGLAPAVTSCVGRRAETAEVRARLDDSRIVTLTGPGGIGKTRLAGEVAQAAVGRFADGGAFVELAELRDGALVPNRVADRLGLHEGPNRSVRQGVLDHLRDRNLLLVLDNCEHLVGACAEFVAEVVRECPGVTVLTTSRQSLGVPGECVVGVPPLVVPAEGAEAPEESDAVRLFADRAAAAGTGFRLSAANAGDVADVCRRLDGVPLAIELAAARVRTLSPRQLAERLRQRLGALGTGPRTAPERQRTLRAAVVWSHELCSKAEQELWARASVFAGSFDLEAAEAVCAGPDGDPHRVLDLVDGLLDKSVLLREDHGDTVRFRLLETLREFGAERLAEAGETEWAARAHRDWIDRLTARADAEWAGPAQLTWIGRLRLEQANIRAALDWSAADPAEAGAALRIACRVAEHWTLLGLNSEARGWLDRALAAAPPDQPERPLALATAALYSLWHSDVQIASARLAEAEKAAAPGDVPLAAFITYVRALEAMIRLDPRCAELAAAAGDAFQKLGDVRRELHPRYIQGVALAYLGDLETSRRVLHRAIELSRACGDHYYRGIVLAGLVQAEVQFGDADAAERAAREALQATTKIGSRFQLAYRLDGLAWTAARRGDHERAATLFGAAATVWEAVGSSAEVAVVLPHLRFKESARLALGEERFAAAFAAGRGMGEERATRFALGEDEPARPASGDVLTKREREVADLVASGLSNKDIAAKLVISRRTADTHVQHILAKLGFRSRAQIASWVTARR